MRRANTRLHTPHKRMRRMRSGNDRVCIPGRGRAGERLGVRSSPRGGMHRQPCARLTKNVRKSAPVDFHGSRLMDL